MAERKIDYNRGVVKRHNPTAGMEIYMYSDTPGVYLNAYGDEVPEAMAKAAGFPVETLGKKRLVAERMKQAMDLIEAEVSGIEDEVEIKVFKERNGYKIMSYGLGRFSLMDPDENRLTQRYLTKEEALAVFNQMAPASTKPQKDETDPKKVKDKE